MVKHICSTADSPPHKQNSTQGCFSAVFFFFKLYFGTEWEENVHSLHNLKLLSTLLCLMCSQKTHVTNITRKFNTLLINGFLSVYESKFRVNLMHQNDNNCFRFY
uniref:Uncharacterized protein n=1 Tax=Anguilla anguilla TaxID=7936 RepID=A0A0E9WJ11_ANGAN